MSPYKLHHDRVQLEGLSSDLLVRSHGRNLKDIGHASDGALPVYGRHRIAVVDFNLVGIHFLHSGALAGSAGSGGRATALLFLSFEELVIELF
jgi:hypothetical protein